MIRPRSDWGAAPPTGGYSWLPNNVGMTVHWEGPTMGAYTRDAVPGLLRGIQRYHMSWKGSEPPWADIAYSFVVDRYGDVWEGRGWNARTAANGSNTGNSGWLAVCYLGGQGDEFTPAAAQAISNLFAAHLARGGAADFNGHRDHVATACPGDTIYAWVHGTPLEPADTEADVPLNAQDLGAIDALVARAAGNVHAAVAADLNRGFAGMSADMRALTDAIRQMQQPDVAAVVDELLRRLKGS